MSGQEETRAKLPEPTFDLLVAQLATQAMMELGEIENPLTGKTEVSLTRARFTLDLLQILKDKTEGNLTPPEQQHIERALYELRMRFVAKKERRE